MSEVLLDKWAAAAHTGLSPAKLINQCRLGTGPTFIRPSPHAMMFRVADLDAWMATWTVHPDPAQYHAIGAALNALATAKSDSNEVAE